MKKQFTALFLILMSAVFAQTPDWSWVREGKGTGSEEKSKITSDASGNIYMTGKFSGASATFAPMSVTNNGTGGTSDIFLVKYDATGAVAWAKNIGGSDDDKGLSIATDGSGNVFITGYFESPTIVFGSITLTNNSNPGIADMFVAKFNSSGTVQWAKNYGGAQQEWGVSISADASGNTYVTGMFFSLSVVFGSYGVVNSGLSDAFLTKIDPSGLPLWAKKIGGGMTDNGMAVDVDGSGNVYVAGEFNSGTISSFSPSIVNSGGYDIFYAKYDLTGNFLYGGKYGGTGNEKSTSLITDGSGNYYISGYYESSSFVLGSVTLANGSLRDMFLVKINGTGVTQWAKRAAGNMNSAPEQLTTDNAGNIYMAGSFNLSTISFGSHTINNTGGTDAFIAKYDASTGSELWARKVGGGGFDEGNGVAADGSGNVYLAGSYGTTVSINSMYITSAGNTDAFITKLCNVPASPVSAGNPTVCPNVTGNVSVTVTGGALVSWYTFSSGGNTISTGNSYNTQAGTYYAQSKNPTTGCINPIRTAVSLYNYPVFNPTVTLTGNTLTAGPSGAYKWYNCTQGAPIAGATSSTFVVLSSGTYAVIISINGCADTSACAFYSLTPTGTVTPPPPPPPPPPPTPTVTVVEEELIAKMISIYPNPNNGSFIIRSNYPAEFIIVNFLGQPVKTIRLNALNEFMVRLEELPDGIYFLAGDSSRKKIVVHR